MKQFTFKRGLRFIVGQMKWELDRRLASGKLQFRSDDGEILNLLPSELLQKWQSQEWMIDEESLANLGNVFYVVTPRDLSTYTAKSQAIVKRRLHYLQRIDPENTPYNLDVWKEKIREAAKEISDAKPPCASSVAAWWLRYRQTRSFQKLIPWQRPASIHQKKPAYAIFEEVIAEVYLTENKLPKAEVFKNIELRIQGINNTRLEDEHIQCPARATIYRWLEDLQQDLVDLAREGAEYARMKYRAAIGLVKTSAILERVEIDHTPLDLIIIDLATGLSLGRPWISLAIDHFSRLIIGFYISIGAPSANSVLHCLRRSILPKDEFLAQQGTFKNPWPAYGIFKLVAVDNGADLHSSGFEQACLELSMELLFCGSKVSYHKGAIERFIKTMAVDLIHTLPGTTFSNPDQRKDYDSEKFACLDMKTLTYLVTKWIVDVYNVTPHRGIKARPLDMWIESAQLTSLALPTNPQQLDLITGIPAQRVLFHYGIEFEGIQYNDLYVQQIRRRTGKNLPIDIKYYEHDVSYIHVFDSVNKVYLRVSARDMEYAEGLTREMHGTIRARARQKYGEQCSSQELLETKLEIRQVAQAALTNKRMGNRKRGAKHFNLNSENSLEQNDPLAAARKPVKRQKVAPPPVLPDGLDDNLPSFDLSPKTGGKS